MRTRTCQICEGVADLANGNQAFCDACWARVGEFWLACSVCGQTFSGYRERNGHMSKHRGIPYDPIAEDPPRIGQAAFIRLPGR